MKKNFFYLIVVAVLILSACMPSSTSTMTAPTSTVIPPTPTPQGKTIMVTSPEDSGLGTLRQAMEEAQNCSGE